MKRRLLPVPESFTTYATLLVNKVHMRPRPERGDVQEEAITVMRARTRDESTIDYRNLFSGMSGMDATL